MKVHVDWNERYPDYIVRKFDEKKEYYGGQEIDIPDELYEEWQQTASRYGLLEQVIAAYVEGDNLSIVENTAKLRGLIK